MVCSDLGDKVKYLLRLTLGKETAKEITSETAENKNCICQVDL